MRDSDGAGVIDGDADADGDGDGDADGDGDGDADADGDALLATLLETARPWLSELPGIAIGIVRGGRAHVGAAGVLNATADDPLTTRSLFNVGLAIAPTLNGAAVIEAGIDLDRPVTEFIELSVGDSVLGDANDVLLRHLLNDSSGIDSISRFGDCELPLLGFWTSSPLPALLSEPGDVAAHTSNWGRSLAGLVIESEEGPFAAAVRTLVLDPAGMTGATHSPDDPEREYAWPHSASGTPQRLSGDCPHRQPIDWFYASVEDVTSLMAWLLERDDLRGELTADTVESHHKGLPRGFGLFVGELPPAGTFLTVVTSWLGYHATIALLPDLDFALVVLANTETEDALVLDGEILETALDEGYGLTLTPPDESLHPDDWGQYAGTYASRNGSARTLVVTWAPGEDVLRYSTDGEGPWDAVPLTWPFTRKTYKDEFESDRSPCTLLAFWRDADGDVDRAAIGSGCMQSDPLFYRVE